MIIQSIWLKILIGVVYGIALGLITIPLSKSLTLSRTEDPAKAAVIDKSIFKAMAVLIAVASSVGVVFTSTDLAVMIRNLILLIPIASIAVVDSLVRKIPNPLLLVMIIVQAIYLTYYSISNHTLQNFIMAGFGFFIGFAACTVPSIIKVPVGNGDVKYCAVLGLCIYFSGFLQSMILMGVFALVCLIFLKVTKKGGMKTLIPMGPLISIGAVITICFPLIEKIIDVANIF